MKTKTKTWFFIFYLIGFACIGMLAGEGIFWQYIMTGLGLDKSLSVACFVSAIVGVLGALFTQSYIKNDKTKHKISKNKA